MWDHPEQGQTIEPLQSGKLKSIEGMFAIRLSPGCLQAKIYSGVNGALLATSDNIVYDGDASEFTFVTGVWTFDNADLALEAGMTYYIQFTATNGNRFFFGTSANYPRGMMYCGDIGSPVSQCIYDLDFILTYGGSDGGWKKFSGVPGPAGPQGPQGAMPSGNGVGDMQMWNGSQWVMIPPGSDGQVLKIVGGTPQWANP